MIGKKIKNKDRIISNRLLVDDFQEEIWGLPRISQIPHFILFSWRNSLQNYDSQRIKFIKLVKQARNYSIYGFLDKLSKIKGYKVPNRSKAIMQLLFVVLIFVAFIASIMIASVITSFRFKLVFLILGLFLLLITIYFFVINKRKSVNLRLEMLNRRWHIMSMIKQENEEIKSLGLRWLHSRYLSYLALQYADKSILDEADSTTRDFYLDLLERNGSFNRINVDDLKKINIWRKVNSVSISIAKSNRDKQRGLQERAGRIKDLFQNREENDTKRQRYSIYINQLAKDKNNEEIYEEFGDSLSSEEEVYYIQHQGPEELEGDEENTKQGKGQLNPRLSIHQIEQLENIKYDLDESSNMNLLKPETTDIRDRNQLQVG